MTLREKQHLFAALVSDLIRHAQHLGYGVSLGEAWRSPQEAARLAAAGLGIKRSLHGDRLAIDLNLFRDDRWLRKSEEYRPLGTWWKQQHPLCRWGGDFTRPDGNHFSLAHDGRA